MPAHRKGELTAEIVSVYEASGGNVSATARHFGLARGTVQYHLRKAGATLKPLSGGVAHATRWEPRELPSSGVRRYIVTSLQNNTRVWQPFYRNLRAYQDYLEAELLVSSFTYNQNAYGKLSTKRGTKKKSDQQELWYDPEVEPLLDASDRDIELAPGLVWCGRMNTLPTAQRPLSGFETYTGTASGILPHAKVAMQSVAQSREDGAKFNYTTGTLGQMNYIQKRAGIRAEFHHVYGALLVEVDSEGEWWVRHLIADGRGTFTDLDVRVENGECREGEFVEAINWGDVHVAQAEPWIQEMAWGEGGMLDELRPSYQFMHDTLDFYRRNHHDRGDPHHRFRLWRAGEESVREECAEVASFLADFSHRDFCQTIVVDSNHDGALSRWLREADYRADPVNALFFLERQLAAYRAMDEQDGDFHLVEDTLKSLGCPDDVRFLRTDEAFVICGRVQCGDHGHLGPDGARGTPGNLARQGRQSNTGHTHSAAVIDGQWVAGTCVLDAHYARGPSSWSPTQIVTYKGAGKRSMVTFRPKGWRAVD